MKTLMEWEKVKQLPCGCLIAKSATCALHESVVELQSLVMEQKIQIDRLNSTIGFQRELLRELIHKEN